MVAQIRCYVSIVTLLVVYPVSNNLNAHAASTQRQKKTASTACPDTSLVRNLALSHWYSTWGRLLCDSAFQEESLSVVVSDITRQPGQCDVTFFRPYGDLKVRVVAAESKIIASYMRPPELRNQLTWHDVDRRICRLTSATGASPWVEAIPKDIVLFAFKALVSIRQRFELVQRPCGRSLSLVSSEGLNGLVEPIEKSVAKLFYVEVLEGPTTVIPVQVRIQEYKQLDLATNKTKTSYKFLSSNPSACKISSAMPFASFGCSATAIGPNGGVPLRRLHENLTSFRESEEAHNQQPLPYEPLLRRLDVASTKEQFPVYDMRQLYPRCVLPAKSMGLCSAAWVFAPVGAFEKQLCRLTQGRIMQPLSPQRLIDCAGSSGGCRGGSVFDAHAAMLSGRTLVTEGCVPYTSGSQSSSKVVDAQELMAIGKDLSSCSRIDEDCVQRFAARLPSPSEMGYQTVLSNSVAGAAATNLIIGESAMQAAILMYGAIVASFAMYSNFLSYREGIYECSSLDEHRRLGTHVVQLLGWGASTTSATQDKKYWIAENSWGSTWGENQFFRKCSITDCRGPLCDSKDNSNPECTDSPLWKDDFGNGCEWYLTNDPDCAVFPDSGQMSQCRNACRNCLPPSQKNGELCGYFRILRGSNHLGIEGAAMHTYVAGHSPSDVAATSLANTCTDDNTWIDNFGVICSWYRIHDPGCVKFQDIGQRAFCRKACRSCPMDFTQVRAPASLADDLRSCGSRSGLLLFFFYFMFGVFLH